MQIFDECEEKKEENKCELRDECKKECKREIRAKYVSDVSNGYIQTRDAKYFVGMTAPLCTKNNGKEYFAIENPKSSDRNVLINKIYYTNLGDSSMLVRSFLCGNLQGALKCTENVINTNTYNCCRTDSEARVLYGNEMCMCKGKTSHILLVNECNTFKHEINGSILLAPGEAYIVEISSKKECKDAKAIATFEWWEENIKDKCEEKDTKSEEKCGC